MNVLQEKVRVKFTFEEISRDCKDERKIELELIAKLEKYSTSSFLNSVWILDKNHNKIEDNRISFKNLLKRNKVYIRLVKLYALILLERGKASLVSLTYDFNTFFTFLEEYKINLLQVKISTFSVFENWLFKKENINKNSKKKVFLIIQDFFHIMYGHSKISKIDGVKNIENPFKSEVSDSYRVIEESILFEYDEYFKNNSLKLHHRIVYWLLRLYESDLMI